MDKNPPKGESIMTHLDVIVNFIESYRYLTLVVVVTATVIGRVAISVIPNGSDSYYQERARQKRLKALLATPDRLCRLCHLLTSPLKRGHQWLTDYLHWQKFRRYTHHQTVLKTLTCNNSHNTGPMLLNGYRRYYRIGPGYRIPCGDEEFSDWANVSLEELTIIEVEDEPREPLKLPPGAKPPTIKEYVGPLLEGPPTVRA